LRTDKELTLFPLISFIVLIPVDLSYFGVRLVLGEPEAAAGWIPVFICYLISYFVIIGSRLARVRTTMRIVFKTHMSSSL
jgi:hypothetical protein